jgi:hypothetical protein
MFVGGYAEVYVAHKELETLERDHLLVPAVDTENVLLRVVPGNIRLPLRGRLPTAAVVADLAEGGARERQQADILWRKLDGRRHEG